MTSRLLEELARAVDSTVDDLRCDPLNETDAARQWLARAELAFDGSRHHVKAADLTE